MSDETSATLEQVLEAHLVIDDHYTLCKCGHGWAPRSDGHHWYAAHLADVVRAWLAEQAARDDVIDAVMSTVLEGTTFSTTWGDRKAFAIMRIFLATLDHRPDGPPQPHSADLTAEQGQVAHGASDEGAGLSEALATCRRLEEQLSRYVGQNTQAEQEAAARECYRLMKDELREVKRISREQSEALKDISKAIRESSKTTGSEVARALNDNARRAAHRAKAEGRPLHHGEAADD